MQSIGERLEEARKRKGISIREAAEATKIRGDYLHKFESNQYDIKLPEIYVRGFLRTYSNFLKLPAEKIINDYNALGLGENGKNSRGINREVYGRMDISVASNDKETKEPAPAAAAGDEAPAETGTRNPATFTPRASSSSGPGGLTRDQLMMVGLIGAGVIIATLIIVLLFSGRGSTPPAKPQNQTAAQTPPADDSIWVRPQPGDAVLTLICSDRTQVTVTQSNKTVLFKGTINRGERREVPYKTELSISSEFPERLKINIGGSEDYELKDGKGIYLKEAKINAPKR